MDGAVFNEFLKLETSATRLGRVRNRTKRAATMREWLTVAHSRNCVDFAIHRKGTSC